MAKDVRLPCTLQTSDLRLQTATSLDHCPLAWHVLTSAPSSSYPELQLCSAWLPSVVSSNETAPLSGAVGSPQSTAN